MDKNIIVICSGAISLSSVADW